MATNGVLLYVEDEENDVLFMKIAVKGEGASFSLQHVPSGKAAIHYLSGRDAYANRGKYPLPDVVLLDLNLPLISGFDTLRWIRAEPRFVRLPVIIFSSSGRPEDRERARELGADEYQIKPASGLEFRRVLRGICDRWLGGVRAKL